MSFSNQKNNLYQENIPYNLENQLYYNKNSEEHLIKNEYNNYNNQIDYSHNYTNDNNLSQKNKIEESFTLKIMEKDKMIFDYMKKEKELNKIISNLNHEISSQKSQNNFLNEQIKEFQLNNSNIINNQNKNNENIILKINEEKNGLTNEITRLNFIIQNHENSIKKAFEDLNEKNETINNLKNELKQKNNYIKKNDEIKSNIRQDNKQIPSLKSKINDLEHVIKVYQEKINELKKNNEIIYNQNQQLLKNQNIKKIEISEKNKNLEKNRYNSDENNLEYSKIYDKFISLKKDSDSFIRLFLNELGNFVNFLEMIKIENSNGKIFHIQEIEDWKSENLDKIKLNENFSLKYEIMDSNINKAKEKIINLFDKGNNFWNKINKERLDSINENKKEFNDEKDKLNEKINIANIEIKKYENLIEELNKDYENIKNNYIKLKQNYSDFSNKNEILENNYNNFIKQIEDKLADFPFEINENELNNNGLNSTQKIIMQISSLINFSKELNKRLKEANKNNKDINISKNKEIKQIHKKINELNNLLKEKDKIINECKSNEENLRKINMQLQKSLFIQENNFANKNNENNTLNNKQDDYIVPEYSYDNDREREIKLQNILDNFEIKKKINNYCSYFPDDD